MECIRAEERDGEQAGQGGCHLERLFVHPFRVHEREDVKLLCGCKARAFSPKVMGPSLKQCGGSML